MRNGPGTRCDAAGNGKDQLDRPPTPSSMRNVVLIAASSALWPSPSRRILSSIAEPYQTASPSTRMPKRTVVDHIAAAPIRLDRAPVRPGP